MHRLLERQLKKADRFRDFDERLSALIEQVNQTYEEQDNERRLASRTLELMSQELLELNRKNLEQSQARIQLLLDHVIDGILTFTREGWLESINHAAASIFQLGDKVNIGDLRIGELIPDLDPQGERLSNYLANSAPGTFRELEARRLEGAEFAAEVSCSKTLQDNSPLYIVFIRDISERKSYEQKLKSAKEQAESANRAKSEFLANISHEFRTPLNAILGFSQILSDKARNDQEREYLDAITASGRGLLALINDVLDLSKIEAGALDLNYRSVNLVELFGEVGRIYQFHAERKKVDFQILVDPNLPAILHLDAARIRQVLINLVGNAIKFTEKGYVRMAVRGRPNGEDGIDLELEVEDSGIGIPPASQAIIFDAFVQKHGQDPSRFQGTGLGLAITKRLVVMMGGSISIKRSNPGQGSVFLVEIPQVKIIQRRAALVNPAPQKSSRDRLQAMGSNVKILLAEDVVMNQVLIQKFLEPTGVQVFCANNGREAIDMAERLKPHLVLMDMRMPIMDGYEATETLTRSDWFGETPIIALTANALVEDQKRAQAAGCKDMLCKPITRETLFDMLARYLDPAGETSQEDAPAPPTQTGQTGESVPINRDLGKWLIEVRESMIMGDISQFADALYLEGEKRHFSEWVQSAIELKNHAREFQIIPIHEILSRLDAILNPIH
ncbi:MAG: response regulator [Acidobacteria bacterium]|nr:response regulator [Acidobacteriota bacterium]